MKPNHTKQFVLLTAWCWAAALSTSAQTGFFGEYFTHQCRDTNQFFNYTTLQHHLLDSTPTAKAIFTPRTLTGGIDENYHSGLYYSNYYSKWAVYNEDTNDSIPQYSGFNVLVPTTNGTMISHTATSANVLVNYTLIDNIATNNKPNALLFISHNWGITGGVYCNHPTGVFYDIATGKWGVFTEDGTGFPVGTSYNIFVVDSTNDHAYIHTCGAPLLSFPYLTYLNHTPLNSSSVILATHNISPGGSSNALYNNSPFGIFYKGGIWGIANGNDTVTLEAGTTFNVLVASAAVVSGLSSENKEDIQWNVFPNPSKYQLQVNYEIQHTGWVSVKLFDITGRQVAVLLEENLTAGNYSFQTSTETLNAGTYIIALNTNGKTARKQVVVVK